MERLGRKRAEGLRNKKNEMKKKKMSLREKLSGGRWFRARACAGTVSPNKHTVKCWVRLGRVRFESGLLLIRSGTWVMGCMPTYRPEKGFGLLQITLDLNPIIN